MFADDYDVLSERGREQAATLGRVVAARFTEAGRSGFDAVFTGPAKRHIDTAQIASESFVAADLPWPEPVVVEGFDEHDGRSMVLAVLAHAARHGGILVKQPELAILAKAAVDPELDLPRRAKAWQALFEAVMVEWLRDGLEFEGIESWASFRDRVSTAFVELRESARGEVALFTSVGPTAVVLHEVLAVPAEVAFKQAWRLYNTSITRVVYSGERMTLDGFNEVAHLPLTAWTHR